MNTHDPTPHIRSECVDVVMKELPEMFCALGYAGDDEFVYGVTYFSVQEEQRRGATAEEIRAQRSQILRGSTRRTGPRTTANSSRHSSPGPSTMRSRAASRACCTDSGRGGHNFTRGVLDQITKTRGAGFAALPRSGPLTLFRLPPPLNRVRAFTFGGGNTVG